MEWTTEKLSTADADRIARAIRPASAIAAFEPSRIADVQLASRSRLGSRRLPQHRSPAQAPVENILRRLTKLAWDSTASVALSISTTISRGRKIHGVKAPLESGSGLAMRMNAASVKSDQPGQAPNNALPKDNLPADDLPRKPAMAFE
jgi:hypothetical protein